LFSHRRRHSYLEQLVEARRKGNHAVSWGTQGSVRIKSSARLGDARWESRRESATPPGAQGRPSREPRGQMGPAYQGRQSIQFLGCLRLRGVPHAQYGHAEALCLVETPELHQHANFGGPVPHAVHSFSRSASGTARRSERGALNVSASVECPSELQGQSECLVRVRRVWKDPYPISHNAQ
jgi:hypothetical protein